MLSLFYQLINFTNSFYFLNHLVMTYITINKHLFFNKPLSSRHYLFILQNATVLVDDGHHVMMTYTHWFIRHLNRRRVHLNHRHFKVF